MRPKLLLVADTYYPKVDGTLRFVEEFVKRSVQQFEISMLVPKYKGKQKKMVDEMTYVKTYKRISLSGYPSIKINFKSLRQIKNAVKKADVVFAQGPAFLSFLSIYYGKKFKKKVIFYPHVITWELVKRFIPLPGFMHSLARKMVIYFYNKCTEILIPYHELQQHLHKAGVKVKMTVARLGVDIQRFTPSLDKVVHKKKVKIPTNRFVIGYVGRLSKEKNVHTLLRAFKGLKDQSKIYLLLVGDGPKSQTQEFKELPNVKITGFVKNVEDYMKAMDVFIMPSTTETTSLATLEAMSSGLAVITSKVGYIKNYVTKGHNGIFFAKNSPSMLAMKIEKLREHPETIEKLGVQARKTVAYSFSWERSINKIKRVLASHIQR
jgi:glycosyltransferase involved in cell wall biosynthesis